MDYDLSRDMAKSDIASAKTFLATWRSWANPDSFANMETMGYLLGAYDFLGRALSHMQEDRFRDWRAGVQKTMDGLLPAIRDQVNASIKQFNEERRELLESRETKEKRYVTARRSVELLEAHIMHNDWDSFPEDCRILFFDSIEEWKAIRDSID